MHAPRSEAPAVCSVFLCMQQHRERDKTQQTIDSVSQLPCCDIDTVRPGNDMPDQECCVFHVGGKKEVLLYGSGYL